MFAGDLFALRGHAGGNVRGLSENARNNWKGLESNLTIFSERMDSMNCNRVIKYLWIVTALFMLPLGLGTCLGGPDCIQAWDVLPVMLLLCFPSGVLFLIVVAVLFEPTGFASAIDYSLIWLIVFGVGYVQWFWLVPKLFARSEITTLGLMSAVETARMAPESKLAPPSLSTGIPTSMPVTKRSRIKVRCFVHFDSKGRSPLERVIHGNFR